MRLLVLASLALASSGGFAQSAFVRFPDAAPREIWVSTGLPGSPPTTGVKTQQSSVQFPLAGAKPTDAIFVWDKKSGNLASKTVRDVQAAGTWLVDSYLDVAEVAVRVTTNGQPVAAANVSLNDGRRTQTQLLDPTSKGEARFFAIKPGTLKITVEYKSKGQAAQPVKQLLDAPLKRKDPVPTITIALPEVAAPAAEAGTPTDKPNESAKASSDDDKANEDKPVKGNPFGYIIGYLVALGIAIAVGVGVYRYFRSNPDTVASKLEQLGVQIPKPGDDQLTSADPLPDPAPIKPQPPQKIILDDAAPAPLAAVSPAPSSVTGQPRLVAENGDELPLDEGTLEVGREVGLGLSLVSESTVSRRHAEITKTADTVIVKDLGSTNGTFVNGAKLTGEVTLRPGDTIQFGAVRFRYEA